MSYTVLDSENRAQILRSMHDDVWVVACLCAAWCDVCREFRPRFQNLSASHPDKLFLWIDVEDRADIVGDMDVDNFPTLLIQQADVVAFFGTVAPDAAQAGRLVTAQAQKSKQELLHEAASHADRLQWQDECNLRFRLRESIGS